MDYLFKIVNWLLKLFEATLTRHHNFTPLTAEDHYSKTLKTLQNAGCALYPSAKELKCRNLLSRSGLPG
jgi:hypothetical protein